MWEFESEILSWSSGDRPRGSGKSQLEMAHDPQPQFLNREGWFIIGPIYQKTNSHSGFFEGKSLHPVIFSTNCCF